MKDNNGDISVYRDSFGSIWRWIQPWDFACLQAQLFVVTGTDLALLYGPKGTKRRVENPCQSGHI